MKTLELSGATGDVTMSVRCVLAEIFPVVSPYIFIRLSWVLVITPSEISSRGYVYFILFFSESLLELLIQFDGASTNIHFGDWEKVVLLINALSK